ncbi:T9SS type A sorting domain-containing protein [Aquimarina agarivorans]|uniref:T9SS type A sorting domain-containing protein n=1 Tax=Aquimarina agarivorans TaxID=980584 RepID=UPI000248E6FD|nr:T9SS type A sorting domain-containing protein [Aquimarina agarivorans]
MAESKGVWTAGDFIDDTGVYSYIGDGTENGLAQWEASLVDAGILTGGPFEFFVGDGVADNIPADGITIAGGVGSESAWVVTDEDLNILGLPSTFSAVNFDTAGLGTCLVWYLRHDGSLTGAAINANAGTDLGGNFDLSNPIEVVRKTVDAGVLSGGPFKFLVGDGVADNIPADGITIEGGVGAESAWVVTDEDLNILGLPPTFSAVNFDTAGLGTCLVWYLRHDGSLTGAAMGANAGTDLGGNFDLSNPIEVVRNTVDAGVLSGGPFNFCVEDGVADNIPADGITIEGGVGSESAWVVTDEDLNILGLPPTFTAVDFDGAGAGTCLVWYLRHDGSLGGAAINANAGTDLTGNFDLSNPITVNRVVGGDCATLSINEFDTELPVTIFPIPASDSLTISTTNASGDLDIKIYSLTGQEVLETVAISQSGSVTFDVQNLEPAVYILSITDKDGKKQSFEQIVIE